MRSLKRFVQLPRAERSLLFEAAFAVVMVRIMLRCFALANVQRAAVAISTAWRSDNPYAADLIAWATQAAARFVPGATCLRQALTAQALLIRHGYNPRLTIGVRKSEDLSFQAHAWVSCEDQILIGGPEVARYTSLLNLGPLP